MNCQHNLRIVAAAISLLAWAISPPLVAMEPSGDWIDVTTNDVGAATSPAL